MIDAGIYNDIARRTGGDFYIGVVGPVRSGKSTFIKKFMQTAVLPSMTDERERTRTIDEMPQSAGGRTIMTSEPKFIPEEAATIECANMSLKVRMVDCVGFLVDGALGQSEDGSPRLVRTPWTEEPIPFAEAAELGTKKVISEHSTVALMVTTDGSIADLPRDSYIDAERKAIYELKKSGIPYVIILNSANPSSPESEQLALTLEKEYGAPVALINCLETDETDITHILSMLLGEFPVNEITVELPEWTDALDGSHGVMQGLRDAIKAFSLKACKASAVHASLPEIQSCQYVSAVYPENTDLSCGKARIKVELHRDVFYSVIKERTGIDVDNDAALLRVLAELSDSAARYKRVEAALSDVESKGYGIVMPEIEELSLENPEIVKSAGGYGVRLRASAKSIHMIRADIQTEINPIVGTEAQSEEIVRFLLEEFNSDPTSIWKSNMFGKSLYELVNEGLHNKLEHMPPESRAKLSETLGRIINEGSGGLICIIL